MLYDIIVCSRDQHILKVALRVIECFIFGHCFYSFALLLFLATSLCTLHSSCPTMLLKYLEALSQQLHISLVSKVSFHMPLYFLLNACHSEALIINTLESSPDTLIHFCHTDKLISPLFIHMIEYARNGISRMWFIGLNVKCILRNQHQFYAVISHHLIQAIYLISCSSIHNGSIPVWMLVFFPRVSCKPTYHAIWYEFSCRERIAPGYLIIVLWQCF